MAVDLLSFCLLVNKEDIITAFAATLYKQVGVAQQSLDHYTRLKARAQGGCHHDPITIPLAPAPPSFAVSFEVTSEERERESYTLQHTTVRSGPAKMPRKQDRKRGSSLGAKLSTAKDKATNPCNNESDWGKGMHALLHFSFTATTLCALLAGGCGDTLQIPQSTFWGVDVSDTQGAKTLAVDLAASTSASTSVHLPLDMVDASADSAKLVLNAKDLTLSASRDDDAFSVAAHDGTVHVEVTFYVYKTGEDACATGVAIGPIDVTVVNDQIQLGEGSVTLSGQALSIVKKGDFELCVTANGDHSGTLGLDAVRLEFGELAGGDKKVTVCHVPPGDPDHPITIEIGTSALHAHLAHGDYEGACQVDDSTTNEPSDADGDGVSDTSDSCANTPVDESVDRSGCSCSQLDSDADGVSNCDDFCPRTESGSDVDAFGCPVLTVSAGMDIELTSTRCVTLSGSAEGGVPPYTYSWSAQGWSGSGIPTPAVMPAGTTEYTLTVMDLSFPPAIAFATVTVYVEPNPGLQYAIEDLGSLSSNSSFPAGINDAGDVVGFYFSDDQKKRAFLYRGGTIMDLGSLGGSEAQARDINNFGQVVGQSTISNGTWHAFFWDPVTGMEDLGTLGGIASSAHAINDAGDIVGFADTGTATHAFFVKRNSVMQDIDAAGGIHSVAYDVNNDGLAVGMLVNATGSPRAFSWQSGTFTDLGTPMLTGGRIWSVNNDGLMAGHAWESSEFATFLMGCDQVVDLGFLADFPRTNSWGMNDLGEVVGHVGASDSVTLNAFVFTGGQIFNLNDLLVDAVEWEFLTVAFAINNAGQITGYGRINGQFRGFLLTPATLSP